VWQTTSTYPYLGSLGPSGRLCVAVGGNGMAAKGADEWGRLGAQVGPSSCFCQLALCIALFHPRRLPAGKYVV
jgi:hypothetical protein